VAKWQVNTLISTSEFTLRAEYHNLLSFSALRRTARRRVLCECTFRLACLRPFDYSAQRRNRL